MNHAPTPSLRGDSLRGYSLASTAAWFLAGGAVTAVFSGSLARLTDKADWTWVLAVGMIVPCFTWVVQATASAIGMSPEQRALYWGDLGRICFWGSVALLPMGLANLLVPGVPGWLSAANVLASVIIMAIDLFRRCRHHGIPAGWPASWCATITVNMCLFLAASWSWW